MPLFGKAAVAMWWHVRAEKRAEFGDWHSHEHFPERMSIPGFRRGSRWTSTQNEGDFFILYELESYDTLTSKGYLDRLNAPTPWSSKMMPHHLNMVRSQCRVVASFGGGVAAAMATIKLSPEPGKEEDLSTAIVDRLRPLSTQPGLTGAHLLLTDTPKTSSPTTEQRIRGADAVADWIVLLSGYDTEAIARVTADGLSAASLQGVGAQQAVATGFFSLHYTMAAQDVASM
jgi:hypothetical protein